VKRGSLIFGQLPIKDFVKATLKLSLALFDLLNRNAFY